MNVTVIEPRRGLRDLGLKETWGYRELLFFLVWRDIKIRYKQTLVGAGWAIIQPVMAMVVFTIFFGRLAGLPSDGLPYPVFFLAALVPWTYFSAALTASTNSMVDNQKLITKVYFPRLILPLASVLSGLVDFGIALVVLLAMLAYYAIVPPLAILLVPLFLLMAVATALAVGLWLSALNAIYRDVRYVVPFLVQFWMFASPVVYPASLVPAKWAWLYGLNPMAGVIEGFRWSLTGAGTGPGPMLLVSVVAVVALLVGGLLFFRRSEAVISDMV